MYDILKYGTSRRFLWVFFFTIILTILYGAAHAECVPQDAVPACLSGIAASPGYTGALIQQADAPGMRRVRQGDKVEDCSGFPARTDRAAKNMLENMVLFTALVAAATLGGVADPHVEIGARIFYWARIAYIPIYMIGIPVARTAVWAISVIGMGMIFASIVQALP